MYLEKKRPTDHELFAKTQENYDYGGGSRQYGNFKSPEIPRKSLKPQDHLLFSEKNPNFPKWQSHQNEVFQKVIPQKELSYTEKEP